MAVNPTQLADEIRSAMLFPAPVTLQLTGWATGVLQELTQSGIATSRVIPGPHPISGMSGASMAALVAAAAGYPFVSIPLLNYCNAIVQHIQTAGQVFYTAPVGSPNPADNFFLNGTITGLDGSTLAALVAAQVGYPFVSTRLLAKCTAIVNHIQTNAIVTDGVIS